MNSTIINLIIAIIVGLIGGYFALRYFFKESILFKIGMYWLICVVLIMIFTALTVKYRESFPAYVAIPIGLGTFISLISLTARTIRNPMSNSVKNLQSLSEGKLDIERRITDNLSDDELSLIEKSVNQLSDTLKKVITNVIESSDNLNRSSKNLSENSAQLSQGSSEQASTTEEISSTVEEINSNIRQNAENSKTSVEIAESATADLSQLLSISEKNHQSVNEIAQKITIINDIAFQTNILALNAAVEAARAGESGKGFAVVATEVRKLAEHSKSAADSINALSQSSLNISSQTNELLKRLVPEIERTVGFLKAITVANNEQHGGINQLNNAIQQLNNVTQQNAAAADELAASSLELTNYALDLAKSIEYFRFSKAPKTKIQKPVSIVKNTEKKTEAPVAPKNKPLPVIEKKPGKGTTIDLGMKDLDDSEFEKF